MSFDLAPPQLPPPPSRFLRFLQVVLLIAAVNTCGLAAMRFVAPDLLDRTVQSIAH
jgi:hypothetical protein